LLRPRELRQHVLTSGGPFAPEALHFLETECRVKMKRGDVICSGHIEHCVGTGEGPAQAGLRQLSGDILASPRRIHQDAAEVATSRSSRARLIRCQLDDPAVGDYLAAGLGDEHLTQIIGNVRGELLAEVSRLYPKDTHGELDSG